MSLLEMTPSPSASIMWNAARRASSCMYCWAFMVEARNSVQWISPELSRSIWHRVRCISRTTLSGAFSACRASSISSAESVPDMSLSKFIKICLSLSMESSLMERAMTCSASFFSLLLPTNERICDSTSSSIFAAKLLRAVLLSWTQESCKATIAVHRSCTFTHIILLIRRWAESETFSQTEVGSKAYLPFLTSFRICMSSVLFQGEFPLSIT
mmetsp:Transcript_56034/g.149972  ORF Transcript_56034/g.149972 Transcript_56034/m.149972 type:complete len:213 (-) Transcript_56034:736-1374(-)